MEKKYECVEDLQGAEWCVGEVDTIEGWRQRAIVWVEDEAFDNYENLIEEIKSLPKEKVLDYITDFYQIAFKEVN